MPHERGAHLTRQPIQSEAQGRYVNRRRAGFCGSPQEGLGCGLRQVGRCHPAEHDAEHALHRPPDPVRTDQRVGFIGGKGPGIGQPAQSDAGGLAP